MIRLTVLIGVLALAALVLLLIHPKEASASSNNDVADFALQYVGYPYTWAGSSPDEGFDCSGFTEYVVLNTLGIDITHSVENQIDFGRRIEFDDIQSGDLVFFQNTDGPGLTHVGIAIGGGEFVHAENENTGVKVSSLYSNYYSSHYYDAVRLDGDSKPVQGDDDFAGSDEVIDGPVNLRSGPGTWADVVAVLPQGASLTAFDGPVHDGGYTWYAIETAYGTGWAAGEFLSLGGNAVLAPELTYTTTDLNLREDPSLSAGVVDILPPYAQVALLGDTRERDGYTWYLVETGYGTGWVAGDYLAFE